MSPQPSERPQNIGLRVGENRFKRPRGDRMEDVPAFRAAWSEEHCMEFLRRYDDTGGREMAMARAIALAVIMEGRSRKN